jgi:hypothetical protein
MREETMRISEAELKICETRVIGEAKIKRMCEAKIKMSEAKMMSK